MRVSNTQGKICSWEERIYLALSRNRLYLQSYILRTLVTKRMEIYFWVEKLDRRAAQWYRVRQISLIFVLDISKSVGCVMIRFLRYSRLTDDNHKPSVDNCKLILRSWFFKSQVGKCQCQSYPPNSVILDKVLSIDFSYKEDENIFLSWKTG